MPRIAILIIISALTATASAAETQPPEVAYPDGYRDWPHVKSMMIDSGHPLLDTFGRLHHLIRQRESKSRLHVWSIS